MFLARLMIEAGFKAELGNPIDCNQYKRKDSPPRRTTPPTTHDGRCHGDTAPSD
jgi:hypothetical protein